MLNYIHAELFKLFKSSLLKVIIIICVVLSFINIIYITSLHDEYINNLSSFSDSENNNLDIDLAELYEDTDEISLIINPTAIKVIDKCCSGSVIFILVGIMTTIFFATDYSNNTIRQTISKGKSRTQLYIGKTIATLIATSTIYLTHFLILFTAIGCIYEFGSLPEGEGALYIIRAFITIILSCICFTSIGIFLAVLTRSLVASITSFIGISIFVPIFLSSAEFIYNIKNVYKIDLSSYWPPSSIANMLNTNFDKSNFIVMAFSVCCFIVITQSISYYLYNKHEF